MKTDVKISVVTGAGCGGWRAGSLQLGTASTQVHRGWGGGGQTRATGSANLGLPFYPEKKRLQVWK